MHNCGQVQKAAVAACGVGSLDPFGNTLHAIKSKATSLFIRRYSYSCSGSVVAAGGSGQH